MVARPQTPPKAATTHLASGLRATISRRPRDVNNAVPAGGSLRPKRVVSRIANPDPHAAQGVGRGAFPAWTHGPGQTSSARLTSTGMAGLAAGVLPGH